MRVTSPARLPAQATRESLPSSSQGAGRLMRQGGSGHLGTAQIEAAISARFDVQKHRVAWYINARVFMSIPALPHVHLWVSPAPKTAAAAGEGENKPHDRGDEAAAAAAGNVTGKEDGEVATFSELVSRLTLKLRT